MRYLRKFLVCVSIISLFYSDAYTADLNLKEDHLRDSVNKSIQLIERMSEGKYGASLITADRTRIGCFDLDYIKGKNIVVFRGSEGVEELTENHDPRRESLASVFKEMKGYCQKNYWNTFNAFKGQISDIVKAISFQIEAGIYDSLLLMGYSRGGPFAMLCAAYTCQALAENKLSIGNISVVTCGAPSVFDGDGAASLSQFAQKHFTHFCNFRANEDLIAPYLDKMGFQPFIGIYRFSAWDVGGYNERVRNKAYTSMDPTLRRMIPDLDQPAGLIISSLMMVFAPEIRVRGQALDPAILDIVTPSSWEAHHFKTYKSYLNDFLKKEKKEKEGKNEVGVRSSLSSSAASSSKLSAAPGVSNLPSRSITSPESIFQSLYGDVQFESEEERQKAFSVAEQLFKFAS